MSHKGNDALIDIAQDELNAQIVNLLSRVECVRAILLNDRYKDRVKNALDELDDILAEGWE